MQEIFPLEGCQMNYVKYLDLIDYGKQAAVFTVTLFHPLNITFHDYWNKITENSEFELEMILPGERKDRDS